MTSAVRIEPDWVVESHAASSVAVQDRDPPLVRVTLWETPRNMVVYEGK